EAGRSQQMFLRFLVLSLAAIEFAKIQMTEIVVGMQRETAQQIALGLRPSLRGAIYKKQADAAHHVAERVIGGKLNDVRGDVTRFGEGMVVDQDFGQRDLMIQVLGEQPDQALETSNLLRFVAAMSLHDNGDLQRRYVIGIAFEFFLRQSERRRLI